MTITVDLSPEVEGKIKLQAASNGVQMDVCVKSLVEEAARHVRIRCNFVLKSTYGDDDLDNDIRKWYDRLPACQGYGS